jgi:undecaprenyl-diphosphatase
MVAVLAAAVTLVLGVREYLRPRLTQFDHAVYRWVGHLPHPLMRLGLDLTQPLVDVLVLAVVVVVAAVRRRYDVIALAILAPTVAVILTEWVGKPLVGNNRPYGLAYPSGHETGFAATAAVLGVLLLGATWSTALRLVAAIGLLGLVLLTCAGLVYFRYHLATETVGGVTTALAVVCAGALLTDWVG